VRKLIKNLKYYYDKKKKNLKYNFKRLIKHTNFYNKVRNPFLKIVTNHIIFYPTPNNINYG